MRFADTSRGRPYAKDPAVVCLGDEYFLYYSMPPFGDGRANDGWAIGIARSRSLDDWQKIGEVSPSHDYETKGVCAPGAFVHNGQVWLFYQTYGNGPKDAICAASSRDGLKFERHQQNPIVRAHGDWNNGRAIDADVIAHDDQLFCYFATRDPENKIQMLSVATCPLASDWSAKKWTQHGAASILRPERAWEQQCIEAPAVMRRDGRWWMFYGGAYNNAPQQIGVAVSDDGIVWQRVSDAPVLPNGAAGSWNESESGHPFVFVEGERTHLFFQGNNDGGKTWYLSRTEVAWPDGIPQPRLVI